MSYEVLVGNVGNVYSGSSEAEAREVFGEYARQSTTRCGRAAGERVTLLVDGEILSELEEAPEPTDETHGIACTVQCGHDTLIRNLLDALRAARHEAGVPSAYRASLDDAIRQAERALEDLDPF